MFSKPQTLDNQRLGSPQRKTTDFTLVLRTAMGLLCSAEVRAEDRHALSETFDNGNGASDHDRFVIQPTTTRRIDVGACSLDNVRVLRDGHGNGIDAG